MLTAGQNTTSVFVAENDGDVVGFAAGNMLLEPRYDVDAELSAAYVRREFQRAGVGRRLVAAVADAQREHGARGLIVWVIAGNKGARAFYEAARCDVARRAAVPMGRHAAGRSRLRLADLDALLEATTLLPGRRGSIVH